MYRTGKGQMIAHEDAARLQMGLIYERYNGLPFRMSKVSTVDSAYNIHI